MLEKLFEKCQNIHILSMIFKNAISKEEDPNK